MTAKRQTHVLVVENPNVVRKSVKSILRSDPQICIVGSVRNSRDALTFLADKRPDVILMEIAMPQKGGLESIRRIMESYPVPVVICSSIFDPRDAAAALQILESGAVACVKIPNDGSSPDAIASTAQFLQTIKLMAEVKVVRRWPRARGNNAAQSVPSPKTSISLPSFSQAINLIGIGASTGGPPVLQTILAALPEDFPVPILVVQHIVRGFVDGLIDWLDQTTRLQVEIGVDGCVPVPGHVYVAPDDVHMGVASDGAISLADEPPDNGLRPSVAHLFRSMADTCGANAVGVLLTGMGKDGAKELKLMRQQGAMTIAQDRTTSVVHGMPGEAIAISAATCVLPADDIAPALLSLTQGKPTCQGALS